MYKSLCGHTFSFPFERIRIRIADLCGTSGPPWWLSGKESAYQCSGLGFDHWVGKMPRRREWQPAPASFPGEPHRLRSLDGYRLWGHKELDKTEQLTLSLSLSKAFGFNFLASSEAR